MKNEGRNPQNLPLGLLTTRGPKAHCWMCIHSQKKMQGEIHQHPISEGWRSQWPQRPLNQGNKYRYGETLVTREPMAMCSTTYLFLRTIVVVGLLLGDSLLVKQMKHLVTFIYTVVHSLEMQTGFHKISAKNQNFLSGGNSQILPK